MEKGWQLLTFTMRMPILNLTPLIFILIRACVHYALFEDEFYLKAQTGALKELLAFCMNTYHTEA